MKWAKTTWEKWADEAIGRRGFWRSLPWFLLCFGSAMGLIALLLMVVALCVALYSGEPVVFVASSASILVTLIAATLGYSVYNAFRQMHVPWDKGR